MPRGVQKRRSNYGGNSKRGRDQSAPEGGRLQHRILEATRIQEESGRQEEIRRWEEAREQNHHIQQVLKTRIEALKQRREQHLALAAGLRLAIFDVHPTEEERHSTMMDEDSSTSVDNATCRLDLLAKLIPPFSAAYDNQSKVRSRVGWSRGNHAFEIQRIPRVDTGVLFHPPCVGGRDDPFLVISRKAKCLIDIPEPNEVTRLKALQVTFPPPSLTNSKWSDQKVKYLTKVMAAATNKTKSTRERVGVKDQSNKESHEDIEVKGEGLEPEGQITPPLSSLLPTTALTGSFPDQQQEDKHQHLFSGAIRVTNPDQDALLSWAVIAQQMENFQGDNVQIRRERLLRKDRRERTSALLEKVASKETKISEGIPQSEALLSWEDTVDDSSLLELGEQVACDDEHEPAVSSATVSFKAKVSDDAASNVLSQQYTPIDCLLFYKNRVLPTLVAQHQRQQMKEKEEGEVSREGEEEGQSQVVASSSSTGSFEEFRKRITLNQDRSVTSLALRKTPEFQNALKSVAPILREEVFLDENCSFLPHSLLLATTLQAEIIHQLACDYQSMVEFASSHDLNVRGNDEGHIRSSMGGTRDRGSFTKLVGERVAILNEDNMRYYVDSGCLDEDLKEALWSSSPPQPHMSIRKCRLEREVETLLGISNSKGIEKEDDVWTAVDTLELYLLHDVFSGGSSVWKQGSRGKGKEVQSSSTTRLSSEVGKELSELLARSAPAIDSKIRENRDDLVIQGRNPEKGSVPSLKSILQLLAGSVPQDTALTTKRSKTSSITASRVKGILQSVYGGQGPPPTALSRRGVDGTPHPTPHLAHLGNQRRSTQLFTQKIRHIWKASAQPPAPPHSLSRIGGGGFDRVSLLFAPTDFPSRINLWTVRRGLSLNRAGRALVVRAWEENQIIISSSNSLHQRTANYLSNGLQQRSTNKRDNNGFSDQQALPSVESTGLGFGLTHFYTKRQQESAGSGGGPIGQWRVPAPRLHPTEGDRLGAQTRELLAAPPEAFHRRQLSGSLAGSRATTTNPLHALQRLIQVPMFDNHNNITPSRVAVGGDPQRVMGDALDSRSRVGAMRCYDSMNSASTKDVDEFDVTSLPTSSPESVRVWTDESEDLMLAMSSLFGSASFSIAKLRGSQL